MKEKILTTIYKKLSEGFNTHFLPRKQFEKDFSITYTSLLELLSSLPQTYSELINSGNQEVIKITRDKYIIERFNYQKSCFPIFSTDKPYTIENLEDLKNHKENIYKGYDIAYDKLFEKKSEDIFFSLTDFIKNNLSQIAEENKNNSELSIKKLFCDYFNSTYSYIDEVNNWPERIIEKFKEQCLSNKYFKLHDIAEKNISDVILSGFESYVVNVGKRNFEGGRSGWATNTFEVINNGKKYSFVSSSKDEKLISGEFINIYIFQFHKKHLLKFSITLDEVELTTYIIWKEFEKLSVKNECEILIAKHHGNENIIFDTRKEALAFQAKVIEIKEGKRK